MLLSSLETFVLAEQHLTWVLAVTWLLTSKKVYTSVEFECDFVMFLLIYLLIIISFGTHGALSVFYQSLEKVAKEAIVSDRSCLFTVSQFYLTSELNYHSLIT